MRSTIEWVMLAYRVPREPSTPRIAIWRKLKRLGVAQLVDGLVALPADARTREQLEWIAGDILEAGGTATVWLAHAATRAEERSVARSMAEAVAAEYRAVIDAAEQAVRVDPADRRALRRLRRQFREITKRDYFPPPDREGARRAVESLGAMTAVRR